MRNTVIIVILISSLFSCEPKHVPGVEQTYDGPLMTAHNVETLYSDSAELQIRMKAKTQLELLNEDREFPDGVLMEFYGTPDTITSTLEANYGYFYAETGIYKASGNVIIRNIKKKEQMNSEELFWNPEKQKIFTEKFVRITTPTEILMGHGLEAKEDFSTYKIIKPTGIFTIEEDSAATAE